MKRLMLTALALVAAITANAVTEEAYTNALAVVRAYNAEHRPAKTIVHKTQAQLLGVNSGILATAKDRAEIIKHTERKAAKTDIMGRKAKASMRDRIEQVKETAKTQAERADLNEHDANKARALEKAAKKSAKAREKIIKTIEQAKKKSTDEDEIAFYDSLEEIINSK